MFELRLPRKVIERALRSFCKLCEMFQSIALVSREKESRNAMGMWNKKKEKKERRKKELSICSSNRVCTSPAQTQ